MVTKTKVGVKEYVFEVFKVPTYWYQADFETMNCYIFLVVLIFQSLN